MKKSFIDRDTTFAQIKENKDIISAVQEVVKVKNIDFDPTDDMNMKDIADILGVDIKDLLLIANEKNGTGKEFKKVYTDMDIKGTKKESPLWIDENEIVDLDVRESLENGIDPFGMIMKSISTLNGKVLHIINSFETIPLYAVLGKQGFEYFSKEEDGVWHIYFYKK